MARTAGSTNEEALAAFIAARAEIDRLLAELSALNADHFHTMPATITWGHAGAAIHIRDQLREIARFAAGVG